MGIEILLIILKWLIPVILTGLGTVLFKIYKDNKAIKKAMVSILRSQIVSKCEKYQELEYLPDYARYCLEDLFKEYKLLGGNHGVEKLVEKTYELPSTKRGGKK